MISYKQMSVTSDRGAFDLWNYKLLVKNRVIRVSFCQNA